MGGRIMNAFTQRSKIELHHRIEELQKAQNSINLAHLARLNTAPLPEQTFAPVQQSHRNHHATPYSDVSTCADSDDLTKIGHLQCLGLCHCGHQFEINHPVMCGERFPMSQLKGQCMRCQKDKVMAQVLRVQCTEEVGWYMEYRKVDADENLVVTPFQQNIRSGWRCFDLKDLFPEVDYVYAKPKFEVATFVISST